jgi:uncharacterized membrane protein YdjX (TVP38/TMEM64 family)
MKKLHKKHIEHLIKKRRNIKNIEKWAFLIFILILTVYLLLTNYLSVFVSSMGEYGLIGVLIAGFFLGYTFTVVPATAIILHFSFFFNPLTVSLIGAIGKMFGDYVIFHYFKRDLPDELEEVIEESTKLKILKKKHFRWIIPAIAGLVLLSPLPDEIALSFLGILKYKTRNFMIISFVLNLIGLLILTGLVWLF